MMLGQHPMSDGVIKKQATLRKEINDLKARRKKKKKKRWQQISRINWLKSDDQITKFFYTYATKNQDFTNLIEIASLKHNFKRSV